jgi:Tat protein secretion system quality control protein TatD with DNase activity
VSSKIIFQKQSDISERAIFLIASRLGPVWKPLNMHQLAKEYDIVRATVGIHPCEAQDIPIEEIPEQMRILWKKWSRKKKLI